MQRAVMFYFSIFFTEITEMLFIILNANAPPILGIGPQQNKTYLQHLRNIDRMLSWVTLRLIVKCHLN